MSHRRIQLAAFISLLLFASLACQALSFGSATEAPTAAAASPTAEVVSSPTANPGSTESSPQPTATLPEASPPQQLPPLPPAQPGPATLDLASLPEIHPLTDFSERIRSVMDFTDPDGVQQQLVTLYDFRQTSVPGQAWYRLFDDNNPFISQKNETALVAGQGYTITSDSSTCQVVIVEVFDNSGQRQPFIDLIEALTGSVDQAQAALTLGDQVVDQYPVDNANLQPGSEIEIQITTSDDSGSSTSTTTLQLADDTSELESGQLFLAQQGSYLAKLELVYSRIATEDESFIAQPGSTMTRSLTYEAVPAASVEPIQPPQGCGAGDDSGNDNDNDNSNDNDNDNENENSNDNGDDSAFSINDIPRLDDESSVVQAGDSLIFQTGQDMQTVLDFYRDALEGQGWEVTDEINLGALASMELVRGSQTLSITMTESGEMLMVTIVLQ